MDIAYHYKTANTLISRKRLTCYVFFLLTIFSSNASALTLMTFNTHWFWDEKKPHEGRVINSIDKAYRSKPYVDIKAFTIANLILNSNADIVGLTEIENQDILKLIQQYLPTEWQIAFKQGRDTYTGQDVGILSRLPIDKSSLTSFPNIYGEYEEIKKNPSKILGLSFTNENQTYYIVLAHLLSKKNNSIKKDKKRAAQANAISKIVKNKISKYDHIIVMGDLNDTPGSLTLKALRNLDNNQNAATLVQTANLSDPDFYSIKKYNTLIDHILISNSLKQNCEQLKRIKTGPLSDHYAVTLHCNTM